MSPHDTGAEASLSNAEIVAILRSLLPDYAGEPVADMQLMQALNALCRPMIRPWLPRPAAAAQIAEVLADFQGLVFMPVNQRQDTPLKSAFEKVQVPASGEVSPAQADHVVSYLRRALRHAYARQVPGSPAYMAFREKLRRLMRDHDLAEGQLPEWRLRQWLSAQPRPPEPAEAAPFPAPTALEALLTAMREDCGDLPTLTDLVRVLRPWFHCAADQGTVAVDTGGDANEEMASPVVTATSPDPKHVAVDQALARQAELLLAAVTQKDGVAIPPEPTGHGAAGPGPLGRLLVAFFLWHALDKRQYPMRKYVAFYGLRETTENDRLRLVLYPMMCQVWGEGPGLAHEAAAILAYLRRRFVAWRPDFIKAGAL